jgi:plastocyanin
MFLGPQLMIGIIALALVAAACSNNKAPVAKGSPKARPTATATASSASSTSSGAPVPLSGKVNRHGTMDLSLAGLKPTLKLEADDFYFEPTFIKTKPGATVTVEFKNDGKTLHTFTIDKLHIDMELQPGKMKTFTVKLPAGSASVPFYCRIHKAQGMQGGFYH